MRRCLPLVSLLLLAACAGDETTSPMAPQFAQAVANPRALASGSVHFYGVEGVTSVAEENYDFNAVRSGPGLEARGHIAWNVRLFNGELSHGRAEVGCAAVVGNTAWISGPVTKLVIEDENWIPDPRPRWALLRVTDMGEGKEAVDIASILSFPTINYMQMFCTVRPPAPPTGILPEFPITRGNITVHSD